MKTMQLSIIALVFLSLFYSCTKDSSVTANNIIIASTGKNTVLGKNSDVGIANESSKEKKPLLIPSDDNYEVNVNTPVTVSFTATDGESLAPVTCGRVFIYQLKNDVWVEVASNDAATATYTFTPTIVGECAYKFKAAFAPGGGTLNCRGSYAGVDFTTQPEICVNVTSPCVTEFTIGENVVAQPMGNGIYEFTITYTLTSPTAVTGVKFQGGATAGGNTGHQITDLGNTVVVNANNNNTVVKWEGNLEACTPQTVYFKYTRNFSCPATNAAVTGNWKASIGEVVLGEIAPLTYSCN